MNQKKTLFNKVLLSSFLGNFFEHYDTALFGFLSVFFAPLIFPEHDQITALILTYAMIPLGMLARPLGALTFGYVGDTYGRKTALFLSLGGMAFVSGCFAFSPTYRQAGLIAPILFCLGRIAQNFLASGETMGGAIYLLENTPKNKHDLISSIYSTSTIGGILLASFGVTFVMNYTTVEWGWRVLYLIGCLTGVFGFLIRKQLHTSEWCFHSPKNSSSLKKMFSALWTYRKQLFFIAITSGFAYANYSIALILLNGFLPLISSVTKEEMTGLNTMLLILDFATLPFFGWIASRISRDKVMLFASLSAIIFGFPLFLMLPQATYSTILFVRVCLVIIGVAFFAPFHAWAQELIPREHRYIIISFGYALGSQLFGGPTAAISLWIYKQTGIYSSITWYWLLLAGSGTIAIGLSKVAKPRENAIKDFT